MQPHISPTLAHISLGAFRSNLKAVRDYVGDRVKIMAIVKANAYGHGAVRIAQEAVAQGCPYLGVARIGEGIELREGGLTGNILVFEVVPPGREEIALQNGLELTVTGLEGARRIDRAAATLGAKAGVHVKIDTGMNRLGVGYANAASVVEQVAGLPHIGLRGVYSHFATSDDADARFANEQLARFQAVLAELGRRGIDPGVRHMANSGAIMTLPGSHFDMVRPGIMLYGYPPRREMPMRFPLKPVLSLRSIVTLVKTVPAGSGVSYGRRYTTSGDTTIATVPVGYADGYPRLLTNSTDLLIRGRRYPVVGTICMDHIMVDLGPSSDVREGDEAVLIGRSGNECIDSWVLAEKLRTIPYEITCQISGRVPRVFVE